MVIIEQNGMVFHADNATWVLSDASPCGGEESILLGEKIIK